MSARDGVASSVTGVGAGAGEGSPSGREDAESAPRADGRVGERPGGSTPPRPVDAVLREVAHRLGMAGVPTPKHDAALLLAHACGCTLADVRKAMVMGRDVASLTAARPVRPMGDFEAMVRRRIAREPLQHIVGQVTFRHLDMAVGPGVFIPRQESETVVQAGLDWLRERCEGTARVVDLCAGSGALGLSVLTEAPRSEVWAVERSNEAFAWLRRNRDRVVASHPERRAAYHAVPADAADSATLRELDGTVDLVVSNPPYIPQSQIPRQPEVRDHDPAMALYGGSADGLLIPGRIVNRAFALLRPGGALVMEHDISQGEALVAHARARGFAQAHTGDDLTGRPRYLMAISG